MAFFAFLAPLFSSFGAAAGAGAAGAASSAALFSAGSMTAGSAMSASLLAGGATAGAGFGLGSLGTALTIGSTGLSVLGSLQGAKAQKQQYMAQAKREELDARQREIDRRQNLIRALASQNAARSAQGIVGNQGSPGAMLRTDAQESYFDQTVNAANAEYRVGTAQQNAKFASSQGTFDAASSLLDFAQRTVRRGSL